MSNDRINSRRATFEKNLEDFDIVFIPFLFIYAGFILTLCVISRSLFYTCMFICFSQYLFLGKALNTTGYPG